MLEPPTYSLVLPIFSQESVLPLLLPRLDALLDRLDGPAEIFGDDRSSDLSTSCRSSEPGRTRTMERETNQ